MLRCSISVAKGSRSIALHVSILESSFFRDRTVVTVIAQNFRCALADCFGVRHRQQVRVFATPPRHDVGRARVRTALEGVDSTVTVNGFFCDMGHDFGDLYRRRSLLPQEEYPILASPWALIQSPNSLFDLRGAAFDQASAVLDDPSDGIVSASLFPGDAGLIFANAFEGARGRRVVVPDVAHRRVFTSRFARLGRTSSERMSSRRTSVCVLSVWARYAFRCANSFSVARKLMRILFILLYLA